MASSKWKSWGELRAIVSEREIVFWGASNWIEQTLERAPLQATCILDNNPSNHGIEFVGLPVRPPRDVLKDGGTRPFVIVTTVNYQSVIDELHELGYVMGDEFCVTPLLNERADKDALKAFNRTVLVSSPDHARTETTGGGLYAVSTCDHRVTKLVGGKGRGLARVGDGYAWVDMLRGIVLLDANFNETAVLTLQPNAEAHGLWYDNERDVLLVGQPGRDSVAIYDRGKGTFVKEIFVSGKWARNHKDNHHVNDVTVFEGSIFLSMFSFSGNWPSELYDGGVGEMDFETGEMIGPVMTGMWMPHSVRRFDGRLIAVDSMRGELVEMSHRTVGSFDGFVRGLDRHDQTFCLGLSEHRYPEKLSSGTLNIPLDAGVILFDPKSRMSRFVATPQITSIHALAIV